MALVFKLDYQSHLSLRAVGCLLVDKYLFKVVTAQIMEVVIYGIDMG